MKYILGIPVLMAALTYFGTADAPADVRRAAYYWIIGISIVVGILCEVVVEAYECERRKKED